MKNIPLPLKEIENTRIENLPAEVMQGIILRLPLDSVFKSRYVSQSWHAQVNSPGFSKLHYARSSRNADPNATTLIISSISYRMDEAFEPDLYYISDSEICENVVKLNNIPFKSLLRGGGAILSSCNGFISLEKKSSLVIICNPVTGDWIQLPDCPNPDMVWITFGFGYDANNQQYKVMRVGYDLKPMLTNVNLPTVVLQVLTLGTNTWRNVGTTLTTIIHWMHHLGIFFHGCLHWLTTDGSEVSCIMSFDVEKETFEKVSIPNSIGGKTSSSFHWLGVLDGCLMVVDASLQDFQHVWLMKEYGVMESWTLEFVIPKRLICRKLLPLAVQKNGNVVLECNNEGLSTYDPNTGRCEVFRLTGLPRLFVAVPHVGTLVTLKEAIAMEGP